MKSVNVRFFAIFREQTGVDTHGLETASTTVADLFKEMADIFPDLKSEAAAMVAINDSMSEWDREICDGDEVLFFPPVAGG